MIKFFMLIISVIMPMAVFAMADYTPPVYGRPTLYGEYEITKSDVVRAGNMYGNAPRAINAGNGTKNAAAKHPVKPKKAKPKARKSSARAGRKVPTPVRTLTAAGTPAAVGTSTAVGTPTAVKPKPAVIVKEGDKESVQVLVDAAPEKKIDAPQAEQKIAPTESTSAPTQAATTKTNIPGEYAADIKGALSNKYDVSSYCVPISEGDGKIPDGFVLMPGRPDLMSCTGKN